MKIKRKTIYMCHAAQLKIGDVVARASGQITNLEFIPINEIRYFADGRVHIVQKTKNGVTMMSDNEVWVVEEKTDER